MFGNGLCELPKYVKFKIFVSLTLTVLSSLSKTSKNYHQTCVCDDFWSFEVRADFPEFSHLKPTCVTFFSSCWHWAQILMVLNSLINTTGNRLLLNLLRPSPRVDFPLIHVPCGFDQSPRHTDTGFWPSSKAFSILFHNRASLRC